MEFVNADDIAKGLSSFNPETVAMAAGRNLLERIEHLADSRRSFALETTLSRQGYPRHITRLRNLGYRTSLLFLWLPNADLAVARVAQRVSLGGHNIPEDVIRRRYTSGLKNFPGPFRQAVDFWKIYNAAAPSATLIAQGTTSAEFANDEALWHTIGGS